MFSKMTILAAAAALVAGTASAEDALSNAQQKYSNFRQLRIDHVSRVDTQRLKTINIGLDRLSREVENGAPDQTVLKGLSSIETSLLGLRLAPADVASVHNRIKCIRASVEDDSDVSDCARAQVDVAATVKVEVPLTRSLKLAGTDRTVGLTLSKDERKPFIVAFYGHSVDVDIGRFFERLAGRDPELLQPIPIDWDYQFVGCLSGGFAGLVTAQASAADAAFRELLSDAGDYAETNDNAWRFTLSQKALPDMIARAGVNVPDRLADFSVDDAFQLITADFAKRYGLEKLPPAEVSGLRNLWIALSDRRFQSVMADVLGQKSLAADQLGQALIRSGWSENEIWNRVFDGAGRALYCKDADKVFQAYGLVYRRGDYPSASRVLRLLRADAGYPAVPGVSISQTSRAFLEANRQNCAAFGPIEQTVDGTDADACNIRELSVDGRSRWEVLAGGAAIQFFVTEEQRRRILSVLRAYEDEPRDGDVLRWRSTSRVAVKSQTGRRVFTVDAEQELADEFPCIVNLSQTGNFEGAEQIGPHMRNYRQHFYPKGKPLSPEALSYVFVLDEFEGYMEPNFQRDMDAAIRSLTESYKNLDLEMDSPGVSTNEAGLTHLPRSALMPLCMALSDQIQAISRGRDISHGEFIKSLLIGSHSALVEGVGLLNPDGVFAEEDFDRQFRFWATESELQNVVLNIEEARHEFRFSDDEAVTESGQPLGVSIFNLSLGQSYKQSSDFEDAKDHLADLKDQMALWNEKGLFVVAAGQPAVGEDVHGIELKRVPANEAALDDPDCHFFPACLSERKNVITVGAVQPSKLGHKRPVLIEWANSGPAVSVAAPGAGVLAKEFGYLDEDGEIKPLPTTSLRDGTSVATVFVTALAARMAAEHPELLASEIKKRLISTAKPYISPKNDDKTVLLAGDEGEIFAGVIDPEVALLDPTKVHVRWRRPPEGVPEIQEFENVFYPEEWPRFTVFTTSRERGTPKLSCRWREIYRIHIEADIRKTENEPPLYKGSVACKNESRGEIIDVATGPLGTEKSLQQNKCLIEGNCFRGILANSIVEIDLANVRDIYFPVVGR